MKAIFSHPRFDAMCGRFRVHFLMQMVSFTVSFAACEESSSDGETSAVARLGDACESHAECEVGLECVDGMCQVEGWYPGKGLNENGTTGHFSTSNGSGDVSSVHDPSSSAQSTSTANPTSAASSSSMASTQSSTIEPTTTVPTSSTQTSTEQSTETNTPDACAGVPVGFHHENPYQKSQAEIVAQGQSLYLEKACNACHGSAGEGTENGVALNGAVASTWPDCRYLWKISVGVSGTLMQSYATQLDTDQQFKILTFLRYQQP
jgi:mono/diheme cytochrome c family protein